jgi:precorrin-6B methylase 2
MRGVGIGIGIPVMAFVRSVVLFALMVSWSSRLVTEGACTGAISTGEINALYE